MTKKRDTPTQPLPDWMIGPCAETQGADVAEVVEAQREAQREAMIRHMVHRFLGWRLPENFAPDEGISFNPEYNVEYNASHGLPPSRRQPSGTNLFDAVQAEAMVRYMLDGGSEHG
jgi:hypothetical protein